MKGTTYCIEAWYSESEATKTPMISVRSPKTGNVINIVEIYWTALPESFLTEYHKKRIVALRKEKSNSSSLYLDKTFSILKLNITLETIKDVLKVWERQESF